MVEAVVEGRSNKQSGCRSLLIGGANIRAEGGLPDRVDSGLACRGGEILTLVRRLPMIANRATTMPMLRMSPSFFSSSCDVVHCHCGGNIPERSIASQRAAMASTTSSHSSPRSRSGSPSCVPAAAVASSRAAQRIAAGVGRSSAAFACGSARFVWLISDRPKAAELLTLRIRELLRIDHGCATRSQDGNGQLRPPIGTTRAAPKRASRDRQPHAGSRQHLRQA